MNHPLALFLDQTTANAPGFRFTLLIRNGSSIKLLLPFPEISDLRFRNDRTTQPAEWYTSLLVSASGGGFTLQPGQGREFDFRVRTCDIETPEQDDHSDYYRWCVGLAPASYAVWFQFKVNSSYFDPDSHWELADLERQAEQEQATVWLGQAESNRVRLLRTASASRHWPSTVVQLAEGVRNGENCTFALHDALLEVGHPELADHFRLEQWHPKGCFALDLILEKK